MFDIEYPPNNYNGSEHYSSTTLEKVRASFFKDRLNTTKMELWLQVYIETIKQGEPPVIAEGYANDAIEHFESNFSISPIA